MGQDLKVVEEAVANLETQSNISPAQAEAFLEDYRHSSDDLQDVGEFLKEPQLALYLKYFIRNRYHD